MTGQDRLDFVLRTLRAHADDFRKRGVAHMAVFGSVARGEAREDSDVDLMVEIAPDARVGLIELADMQLDAEDLLGCRVDFGTRRGLRPGLADAVKRDAVNVF